LAGFTDADGCFFVSIYDSPKSKLGVAVQLVYVITQHIRDQELVKGLIEYLGCGKFSERKEACDFKVQSLADISAKIIPFFSKYQLQGIKALNFEDFSAVAKIMEAKGHLTREGIESVKIIKMKMNKGRF